MQVVCVFFPQPVKEILQSVAEVSLLFTPQIAVSDEAIFLEVEGSRNLFRYEECILRLRQWLSEQRYCARVSMARDIPTALAFAKFQAHDKEALPLEAISCYFSPFKSEEFKGLEKLRELGLNILSDFQGLPIQELASRFGKEALWARDRIAFAGALPWPRFSFEPKLVERADFECAAQIEQLEPVLFLLKQVLDRILLRLYNRQEKLQAFDLIFHFDPLARNKLTDQIHSFSLPTPQWETKPVYEVIRERLHRSLQDHPLEEALEGVSLAVREIAPGLESNRDFFSKEEEAREGWGAVTARIRERLGNDAAFLAAPRARLLPEASWSIANSLRDEGVQVKAPLRPLRLFQPAIAIERKGLCLKSKKQTWKILSFSAAERITGEWWLGGFFRDYFRVETGHEELWIFRTSEKTDSLFLHGIFD